jgi:hypothetical protein
MATPRYRNLTKIGGLFLVVVLFMLLWGWYEQLTLLKKKQQPQGGKSQSGERIVSRAAQQPATPEDRYLVRYLGAPSQTLTRQDINGDRKPEVLAALRYLSPFLPDGQNYYSRAVVISPSEKTFKVIFDTEREFFEGNGQTRWPKHRVMKIGAMGTREIRIFEVDQNGAVVGPECRFTWDSGASSYVKQTILQQEPKGADSTEPSDTNSAEKKPMIAKIQD